MHCTAPPELPGPPIDRTCHRASRHSVHGSLARARAIHRPEIRFCHKALTLLSVVKSRAPRPDPSVSGHLGPSAHTSNPRLRANHLARLRRATARRACGCPRPAAASRSTIASTRRTGARRPPSTPPAHPVEFPDRTSACEGMFGVCGPGGTPPSESRRRAAPSCAAEIGRCFRVFAARGRVAQGFCSPGTGSSSNLRSAAGRHLRAALAVDEGSVR